MNAKNFFIVKGAGLSDVSPVNAFDKVLIQAGLDNVNIVPVSSIISGEAVETPPKRFETGEIVYTVISKNTGIRGDRISAGLIWGLASRGREKMGLVVTAQQNFIDNQVLEKSLRERLQEMAASRGMTVECFKFETASLEVQSAKYGCVAVIFVYVF